MTTHRRLLLLATLLLLAPAAHAGTSNAPEVTDAADDVAISAGGPLDLSDPSYPDVDLLKAWFSEPDATTVEVHLETSGPAASDTGYLLTFTVQSGPTSVFGSTASGVEYTIDATGTTINGGPATAVAQDGNTLTFTVARSDIGASGGDVLSGLYASASRTVAAGCVGLCNDRTGTDRAPDSGTGTNYTLARPDIVGAAQFTVTGGSLSETVNGTALPARTFTGATVETEDGNATATFTLSLTNSGTDVDTYDLSVLSPTEAGSSAALSATNTTLDPGASATFTVDFALDDQAVGSHGFVIKATSTNGADTVAAGALQVVAPAPPAPTNSSSTSSTSTATGTTTDDARDPVVGGGTFLQDAAEGMAFDKAFGDWAEVVLLALFILLLVLLVFLILALAGTGWIKVVVTPRTLEVLPGTTAEFHVEVRNRKRRYHDALAYFDGDTTWKTGVLLRGDEGTAPPLTGVGDEAKLALSAREEPGDAMEGTLRVQVPKDALEGETDRITLSVVPVDERGAERGRKGGRARIKVRAAASGTAAPTAGAPQAAAAPAVRLSRVTHDPEHPHRGDEVTTTATIENDDDTQTLRLRIVLQIDGKELEEQVVEVPPRSARAVLFPWVAQAGNNKVKVQVYEA